MFRKVPKQKLGSASGRERRGAVVAAGIGTIAILFVPATPLPAQKGQGCGLEPVVRPTPNLLMETLHQARFADTRFAADHHNLPFTPRGRRSSDANSQKLGMS